MVCPKEVAWIGELEHGHGQKNLKLNQKNCCCPYNCFVVYNEPTLVFVGMVGFAGIAEYAQYTTCGDDP
jgi:hypothetical protein